MNKQTSKTNKRTNILTIFPFLFAIIHFTQQHFADSIEHGWLCLCLSITVAVFVDVFFFCFFVCFSVKHAIHIFSNALTSLFFSNESIMYRRPYIARRVYTHTVCFCVGMSSPIPVPITVIVKFHVVALHVWPNKLFEYKHINKINSNSFWIGLRVESKKKERKK